MKRSRVRAEKMKEIGGEILRFCSACKTYLPLVRFARKNPRPGVKNPGESAKFQAYCRACMMKARAASRVRQRESNEAKKAETT